MFVEKFLTRTPLGHHHILIIFLNISDIFLNETYIFYSSDSLEPRPETTDAVHNQHYNVRRRANPSGRGGRHRTAPHQAPGTITADPDL